MKRVIFVSLAIASFAFANSPSELKNLTKEHKDVYSTHKQQLQTIINKKEVMKEILINTSAFIYELQRFKNLLVNGFLINAENEFFKE